MANSSSRLIAGMLSRALGPLGNGGNYKLRLDTGPRLTRIELITEPPYELGIDVPPGAAEVSITGMPECVIKYIDYYDQHGRLIVQMSFREVVTEDGIITIQMRFYVSSQ